MIGSSENRVSYDGNGIATEFAYTFKILEKSDMNVLHVAADGTETLLTKDYYVDMEKSVVLYPGYAPGAEIPESERPPILPEGERLVLYREVPITQESALDKHWPFNVVENGLDKLTIICQQMWDRLQRSFYVSEATSTNFDTKIPIEAGKTFRVKDDGTGFEVTEDPGKVIDGAKALLKQTTEQAEFAKEQADASSQSAVNAQNAANAAEAVAPEYAKTKEVLDNIVSYTNTATEQASIATAKADAANTSATNASQSYANADAIATQLTEYLATKETLTAPAIDKTLSISGAGADSQVVGDVKAIVGDIADMVQNYLNSIPLISIALKTTFVNKTILTTGQETDNNFSSCSDYIEVDNSKPLYAKIDDNYTYCMFLYDSSKEYIGRNGEFGTDDIYYAPKTNVYENAKYIRFVVRFGTSTSAVSPLIGKHAKYFNGYTPENYSVKNGITKNNAINVISNKLFLQNQEAYIPLSCLANIEQGSFTAKQEFPSRNRIKTDFIEINNSYPLKVLDTNNYQYYVALYDNNKEYISGLGTVQNSSQIITTSSAYVNYDKAKYVRFLALAPNGSDDVNIKDIDQLSICQNISNGNVKTKLKVMTLNLGRFSYGAEPWYLTEEQFQNKKYPYRRFFGKYNCDILCLQECGEYMDFDHLHPSHEEIFAPLYPYEKGYYSSTHIKSKYPIIKSGTGKLGNNRDYAWATMDINGKVVYIVSAHLSVGSDGAQNRKTEMEELIALCQQYDYYIIGMDSNITDKAEIDTLTNAGMKACNGGFFGWQYTYANNPADYERENPLDSVLYLDNIFVSPNIRIDNATSVNEYKNLTTDHIAYMAELTLLP